MENKFDSYVLHIESETYHKLNKARELTHEETGMWIDFDKLIAKALGRYMTAVKYNTRVRQKSGL